MPEFRRETDSLGVVEVPADKLWGAQTQRSLEHFSIGRDLIPREMITAYATLKKAAANANRAGGRLDDSTHRLIVQACDEILAGQHHDMFPLHVGSALPDQSASYRPSAVERALADDQSGALADARPRRACLQSDQATVGLRQGKVSRLGQEPGARAHYVCAGQPLPGAQTAASSRG